MRNRTIQLNIRLTEAENNRLKRNSHKANLTASAYIRMLINGYQPKETPLLEYEKLLQILTEIYAKIGRSEDIQTKKLLAETLLELQKQVTQPERISK